MKAPEPTRPTSPNSAESADPTPQSFTAPCRNLRNKEMYYQAPGEIADPAFSSGLCWCLRTQDALGPDGAPVDSTQCCAGRRCYVE